MEELLTTDSLRVAFDRYAKVAKFDEQVKDLFHSSSGGDKLRAIRSRFNCSLILGVPVNYRLVEEMQDPSDRTSIDQVEVQVGINKGGHHHFLPKGLRAVIRNFLFSACIHQLFPIIDLVW
jgi:hypothetical protein